MKVDTFASINIFIFTLSRGALPLLTGMPNLIVSQMSAASFVLTVGGGHSDRRAAAVSHFLRRGWNGRVQVVFSKKMCGKNIVRLRSFGLSCPVGMQLILQPAAVGRSDVLELAQWMDTGEVKTPEQLCKRFHGSDDSVGVE